MSSFYLTGGAIGEDQDGTSDVDEISRLQQAFVNLFAIDEAMICTLFIAQHIRLGDGRGYPEQ